MGLESKPQVLFGCREIEAAVSRLAAEIRRDYYNKYPILMGVLKGSFVFLADLIRRLDFPLEVEFIRLFSYSKGKESSGKVRVVQGLCSEVKGRHVLIIEDIVDTGLTTTFLLDYLRRKKPSSIRVCALTSKPSRRKFPVTISYLGFTVPNSSLSAMVWTVTRSFATFLIYVLLVVSSSVIQSSSLNLSG